MSRRTFLMQEIPIGNGGCFGKEISESPAALPFRSNFLSSLHIPSDFPSYCDGILLLVAQKEGPVGLGGRCGIFCGVSSSSCRFIPD